MSNLRNIIYNAMAQAGHTTTALGGMLAGRQGRPREAVGKAARPSAGSPLGSALIAAAAAKRGRKLSKRATDKAAVAALELTKIRL